MENEVLYKIAEHFAELWYTVAIGGGAESETAKQIAMARSHDFLADTCRDSSAKPEMYERLERALDFFARKAEQQPT